MMYLRKNRRINTKPLGHPGGGGAGSSILHWNNRKMLLKLQKQLRLQGLCLSSLAMEENPAPAFGASKPRHSGSFGLLDNPGAVSGNVNDGTSTLGCHCHCACAGSLMVAKATGECREPQGAHANVFREEGVCVTQPVGVQFSRSKRQPRSAQSSSGHRSHRYDRVIPSTASGLFTPVYENNTRALLYGKRNRSSSHGSSSGPGSPDTNHYRKLHRPASDTSAPPVGSEGLRVSCQNHPPVQLTKFEPNPDHYYHHHQHHHHHTPPFRHQHRQQHKLCIRTTTAAAANRTTGASIPICMQAMHSFVSVRETHHIAQAQQEKNAKLREAFGISEYFVEGTSFDQDRKAKEDLAKSEALQKEIAEKEKAKEMERANRKRYALVRTPSPEKESGRNGKQRRGEGAEELEDGEHDDRDEENGDGSDGGKVNSKGNATLRREKDDKKKKKKKARDASSSPERKKDKKKKSKKNKKER
ncbi:uncharacterized protein LOC128726805 isoform X1 [Anopheles nili]|uniref:uncharacterized protein LOC128726805 isoform X1 n=1 Tax=Anopheles nili TaxID=185578 RepID=UPI00237B5DF5|nr:uncharacterized protein LOC128726805 isoform X1 [Anopheles nili]